MNPLGGDPISNLMRSNPSLLRRTDRSEQRRYARSVGRRAIDPQPRRPMLRVPARATRLTKKTLRWVLAALTFMVLLVVIVLALAASIRSK